MANKNYLDRKRIAGSSLRAFLGKVLVEADSKCKSSNCSESASFQDGVIVKVKKYPTYLGSSVSKFSVEGKDASKADRPLLFKGIITTPIDSPSEIIATNNMEIRI